ncbi:hypothetical protein GCM10010279_50960 [Streptomyces mutabilis]|nr:hypothetical protein [Streptomyces mutabilis]GGQ35788.1 hypothetical protein GCM10010279_50960 [Streptomyces mutabilis]
MQSFTGIRALRMLDDDEIALCASPMFHIGAIGYLAPTLLISTTTVIMPSGQFDAEQTLDVIETE